MVITIEIVLAMMIAFIWLCSALASWLTKKDCMETAGGITFLIGFGYLLLKALK